MIENIEIELEKIKQTVFSNELEKLKQLEQLNNSVKKADENLLFELGKSYFFLNKFNEAKSCFLKVLEINKNNIYAVDLLSKSYKKTNQNYYALRLLFRYRTVSVDNINKEIVSLYINVERYDLLIKYIYLYMNNCYENKDILNKYAVSMVSHLNIENNRRKVYAYSKRILKNIDKQKEPKFYNSILNEFEIAQRKIVLQSYPRRMTVSLISLCNLRCKMCPYNKNVKFQLSKYQVDNIAKLLPYIEEVEWNGGEAFLFKYFDYLLDEGYKNNVKQYVTSNGLLINDKYAEKIVKYDIDLTLSIDSVDKELYEYIRTGANFDLLIKRIEKINYYSKKLNKKAKLSINSVLSKWNYKNKSNFIDIIYFAKKYNFSCVRISIDQYDKNKKLINDILLDFQNQKEQLINLAKELNIELQLIMPEEVVPMKEVSVHEVNNKVYEESITKKIFKLIKNINKAFEFKFNFKRKNKIIKQYENKNKNYQCLLPFKKMIISFKGDFKPECVCPDFICHLAESFFVGYVYSTARFTLYNFLNKLGNRIIGFFLNYYRNKTEFIPTKTYRTIMELWNGKEIQEMRKEVYDNNLECFLKCYLSDDKKNNV